MPIQITANAAALSWLALCQSLDSRAVMEGNIFQLLNENTKMSLTQTANQATATQTALEAQASQTMKQGIMAMVGGGLSLVATGVATYQQGRNEAQIKSLSETTEKEMTVTKVDPEVKGPASSSTPSASKLVPESEGKAEIVAKNTEDSKSTETKPTKGKAEDNLTEENKAAQQFYEKNATWWLQNGRTFSDLATTFCTQGLSNLITFGDIQTQGKAKAAEAYAQGFGQVLSTQNGIFTSALSSCDSFMQNTNSTVAAIISASKG